MALCGNHRLAVLGIMRRSTRLAPPRTVIARGRRDRAGATSPPEQPGRLSTRGVIFEIVNQLGTGSALMRLNEFRMADAVIVHQRLQSCEQIVGIVDQARKFQKVGGHLELDQWKDCFVELSRQRILLFFRLVGAPKRAPLTHRIQTTADSLVMHSAAAFCSAEQSRMGIRAA